MFTGHVVFLALALALAANSHALSPARFETEYAFRFEPNAVALSAKERQRFFEFVESMASRGQCAVEIVLIDGLGGIWGPKDTGGKPSAGRGAYLVEYLRKLKLHNVYFVAPGEAKSAAGSPQVQATIAGLLRSAPCHVGKA